MSTETEMNEQAAADPAMPAESTAKPARKVNRGIVLLLLLLAVAGIAAWYVYSQRTEETDDAEIDGHLVPIAARIDGTITTVHADDNQVVKAGQVLVELDRRDYQVALDQARAQYAQANAQVSAAGPNVPMTRITNQADVASDDAQIARAEAALAGAEHDLVAAQARLKQSEAVNERAQANLARYQTLLDKSEVARADYDQYKADAAAQIQNVAANQAAIESAEKLVDERRAQLREQQTKLEADRSNAPLRLEIRSADIRTEHASAEAAQAAVEKANLNLGYGAITAPVSGVITQRSAEPGERVSSGQQLMMLVETDDLWVTANFKETQLARMHPGERVTIHVDALRKDFEGTVESMPAITGARTSVLPPENATGNYVKVIQRLSVRIRFKPGQDGLDKLRPGMSVEPKVTLE